MHFGVSSYTAVGQTHNKTDFINDPLGQTHSHVSSEHCFLSFCFSRFENSGRTYIQVGRTDNMCENNDPVTLGWPSGSTIYKYIKI